MMRLFQYQEKILVNPEFNMAILNTITSIFGTKNFDSTMDFSFFVKRFFKEIF